MRPAAKGMRGSAFVGTAVMATIRGGTIPPAGGGWEGGRELGGEITLGALGMRRRQMGGGGEH